MASIPNDLVQQLALALNASSGPPVKDGVAYRILTFKVEKEERWVVGMVPDIIDVDELFTVVNESYALFLKGETTPNGIVFLSAKQPKDLIPLATTWYYGEQSEPDTDTDPDNSV